MQEKKEEVEPEQRGIKIEKNETLGLGLVGKSLEGRRKNEPLHEGGEGQNQPPERGEEVGLYLLKIENTKDAHDDL